MNSGPQHQAPAKPTFREALGFWARLGFISFGGPAGQIAIMHTYLVERKRWISDSRFLHALNYCMILPGPEAQQLATYIGWLLHGRWGGIAAGMLFVLPSMFILLGLSIVYVTYGSLPWVAALFTGSKPAVIAIVIVALFKIGKKSLLAPFHWVVAVGAFLCIFFFHVPFPLIILGAITMAALLARVAPAMLAIKEKTSAAKKADEAGYYLNSESAVAGGHLAWHQAILRPAMVGLMLWGLPFAALLWLASDPAFWRTLSLFFTQAALVTFGGAYAVLPYVAQVSVEQLGWLSSAQMMDGLALGETTPGPLIMVLAFVGFMAGNNHFNGSLAMGSLALGVTTYYTFLPSFLFIFAGAPLIERTRDNVKLKAILALVTAAVVGVVLNLTIYLGKAVLFPVDTSMKGLDLIALAWVVISFIALYRFKANMIAWLGISSLFGLVVYLLC